MIDHYRQSWKFAYPEKLENLKIENKNRNLQNFVKIAKLSFFGGIRHFYNYNYRPSVTGLLANYGCAGVGDFDQFSTNVGIPVDDVDVALHKWRLCMRCAQNSIYMDIAPYDYDELLNMCGKCGSIEAYVFWKNFARQ